jgi:capsular polysaccharide export protein
MAIRKKFLKLLKEPKAFFTDSHNPFLKFVLMQPKENVNKVHNAIGNSINEFRFTLDLWRSYRNKNLREIPAKENNLVVAILPTGIPYIDKCRIERLQDHGVTAILLPIWLYINSNHDMDDFEFLLSKNIDQLNTVTSELIKFSIDHGAIGLAFYYECSLLARSLILRARNAGLKTFLDLPGLMQNSETSILDGALSFTTFIKKRLKTSTINIRRARIAANVGGNDSAHLLLLPPRQLNLPRDKIESCVFQQVSSALSFCKTTDHLIIITKFRLNSLNQKSLVSLLKTKYRKTVLFYSDIENLDELLDSAAIIYAPQNLLSPEWEANSSVKIYTLDQEISFHKPTLPIFSSLTKAFKKTHSTFLNLSPCDEREDVLRRLFDGYGFNVVAVPDKIGTEDSSNNKYKHLKTLLNTRSLCYGAEPESINAEVFLQWGAEPAESKERPEYFRSKFGTPRLYIEDGFIRSINLWTNSDEPSCSIIFDTRSVYYDATNPSLLESILASKYSLNRKQITRSQNLIKTIVQNKISKYNFAPIIDLDFRQPKKRTILLIDQKINDMSIKYGAANAESFKTMLNTALNLDSEVNIIIKQHPCAINADSNQAHFNESLLADAAKLSHVHFINFDINPYSLINAVDEVWVVSSGMGFEALMAGKHVRCFGIPFYSNWGLTQDEVKCDRRNRNRKLEDIFYVFYLMLTRYVNPKTGELTTLENVLEFFVENTSKLCR